PPRRTRVLLPPPRRLGRRARCRARVVARRPRPRAVPAGPPAGARAARRSGGDGAHRGAAARLPADTRGGAGAMKSRAMNSLPAARGLADLRALLDLLREQRELVAIDAEVDPDLEAAEVHRRVIAAGGPALLFRRIKGSPWPVVTNLFG